MVPTNTKYLAIHVPARTVESWFNHTFNLILYSIKGLAPLKLSTHTHVDILDLTILLDFTMKKARLLNRDSTVLWFQATFLRLPSIIYKRDLGLWNA